MIEQFLQQLMDAGEVLVSEDDPPNAATSPCARLLKSLYAEAVLELPGSALDYAEGVAFEGVRRLYQLGQCVVLRDWDKSTVHATITAPLPELDLPETVFNLDLTLRYLPQLFKLAKGLSPGDPMLASIQELGGSLPLSSVGIPVIDPDPQIEALILDHPGLRLVYAERILLNKDSSRLQTSAHADELRTALQEATGLHPPPGFGLPEPDFRGLKV